MKIDRHARQTAKKYFRACVRPDGSLDEQGVRDIVQLLVNSKPRNYLGILTRIQRLVDLSLQERAVRIETATPLADEGASIFGTLEQRFGAASSRSYRQDASLIGGVRIIRGSSIWDGTLLGRLERLKLAFS